MGVRYCVIVEIQDDVPHLHGVLHSNYRISDKLVKGYWRKFIAKHTDADTADMRIGFETIYYARGAAEYVMKYACEREIQLPQRGWLYRLTKASHHYG